LKNNADVTVEVYNVLGKLVKSMNLSDLTAGTNTVTLDLAGLNAGLYTYTVTVGAEKLTRTLMVK
jgi:flagellar hook assembly protein FlgD